MARRRIIAAIGMGSPIDGELGAICRDLGRIAIEAGFRIATGGLGGVMEAVSLGAHESPRYREGDVIGILPSYDGATANPHVDIVIPTGLGIARNVVLVSTADVVVAIGGGSGTLSELAVAWQLGKPIIAIAPSGGWAQKLAGQAIDERARDRIREASDGAEAVGIALELL